MPQSATVLRFQPSPLTQGETPMPFAPQVTLANGKTCIPQHYLQYSQSLATVRDIVSDISVDELTPIFVAEDDAGLYLQVGMIGRENYDRSNCCRPHKLVYGRKWRIDANTPTSEVIQTAFLAVKKAREHEVRELLTIVDQQTGKTSAVFSNHHDLPLMAANTDLVEATDDDIIITPMQVQAALLGVKYAQRPITVINVTRHGQRGLIVDLQLGQAPLARKVEGDFAELDDWVFTVLLSQCSATELLYEIMDALIKHSDRSVDELFRYQGFARFSCRIDPRRIASLSVATRPYARDASNSQFTPIFKGLNYEVDSSRVPSLGQGRLAAKNQAMIARFSQLAGHLPKP